MKWIRYSAFYIHCVCYKDQKPSPFDNASTPFLGDSPFLHQNIYPHFEKGFAKQYLTLTP